MDRTKVVNKIDDVERDILFNEKNKGKIICILFYADWCGACKNFKPLFFDTVKKFGYSNFIFVMGNVDTAKDLSQHFGIESLPTTYIYKIDDQLLKSRDKNNFKLRLEGGGETNSNKITETLQSLQ